MDLLAASLRYWVSWKLNNDPGWKNVGPGRDFSNQVRTVAERFNLQLDVIISDASVPGEGEHKIMDWIRRQRSHADHDPNTSHVIYGLVSGCADVQRYLS
jgi:5'-3' exoribonuclease 2